MYGPDTSFPRSFVTSSFRNLASEAPPCPSLEALPPRRRRAAGGQVALHGELLPLHVVRMQPPIADARVGVAAFHCFSAFQKNTIAAIRYVAASSARRECPERIRVHSRRRPQGCNYTRAYPSPLLPREWRLIPTCHDKCCYRRLRDYHRED